MKKQTKPTAERTTTRTYGATAFESLNHITGTDHNGLDAREREVEASKAKFMKASDALPSRVVSALPESTHGCDVSRNDLESRSAPDANAEATCEPSMFIVGPCGSGRSAALCSEAVARARNVRSERRRVLVLATDAICANDLRARIRALADGVAVSCVDVLSLARFALMIVRRLSAPVARDEAYMVLGDGDARLILNAVLTTLDLPEPLRERTRAYITRMQHEGIGPKAARRSAVNAEERQFANAYNAYRRALVDARALDAKGLLRKAAVLMAKAPAAAGKWLRRYAHVLVDDVDLLGPESEPILRSLEARAQVVATAESVDRVPRVLSSQIGVRVIHTSGMSPPASCITQVVSTLHGGGVSENAPLGERVMIWAISRAGSDVAAALNRVREAAGIGADEFGYYTKPRNSPGDIAVVCPDEATVRQFAALSRSKGFQWNVLGGDNLHNDAVVRGLVALLRVVWRGHNADMHHALLTAMPVIGVESVETVRAQPAEAGTPLVTFVRERAWSPKLGKHTRRCLEVLRRILVRGERHQLRTPSAVAELCEKVLEWWAPTTIEAASSDVPAKSAAVAAFLKIAKRYTASARTPSLGDFLDRLATGTLADDDPRSRDRVTLATPARMRGRRFRHVILVGLDEARYTAVGDDSTASHVRELAEYLSAIRFAKESAWIFWRKHRSRRGSMSLLADVFERLPKGAVSRVPSVLTGRIARGKKPSRGAAPPSGTTPT